MFGQVCCVYGVLFMTEPNQSITNVYGAILGRLMGQINLTDFAGVGLPWCLVVKGNTNVVTG